MTLPVDIDIVLRDHDNLTDTELEQLIDELRAARKVVESTREMHGAGASHYDAENCPICVALADYEIVT